LTPIPAWLVAPDSFKGTFPARLVAEMIADGVRAAGGSVDLCPVADGGEGTLAVLLGALGGATVHARARDPLGREVEAGYGLLDEGRTAIIETAEASGLDRVAPSERDAEAATSTGTGDLIVAAARSGAKRILVAVGGSACTDGGEGAMTAIRDAGGLGDARLDVICDTTTPFDKAASVFAPQKGADATAVLRLAQRLDTLAPALPRDPRGIPMTGCAGGLSGALWACLGARLRPGGDFVLDAVGFDGRAAAAGRVVTGEGRLDRQSLDGKLVSVVARRAAAVGAEVHAVVGQARLDAAGIGELALGTVLESSTPAQLREAGALLAERERVDVT
jgi:glycerate kinase